MKGIHVDDWGGMIIARHAGRVIMSTPNGDGKWNLHRPNEQNNPILVGLSKGQAKRAVREYFQEVE
ncbi:hypothetical protein [Melghirimyces algeriensis]|uniref:Uncharacterized protein n=1 Tax=Melghirimyces algeriensis TaxID=910412 RepID=A0A521C4P6_9BACL|nr:hypothetical protein [Melghirimyces algeriensis]SMO54456.1 hypothetical protein SAMN06264849_103130 [Melghirimyces algeriensis]